MDSFDLFYDAQDGSSASISSTTATTTGSVSLGTAGAAFVLTAPASPLYVEGQLVLLWDGSAGFASCYVTKVTDSTNLTLKPVQSAVDTVTFPHTFPGSSTIFSGAEFVARCVIDLSEAPEDAYTYLVVACGTLESSGTPSGAEASLWLNALQDDPYSGDGAHGASRVDLTSANPDRANYVAAAKVSLVGGQRYEQAVYLTSPTAGATATIGSPRILALRYLSGTFAGDGKTAEQTTTSVSYQDHLDLGANIPAGEYLIVATWVATNTNTATRADVVLELTSGGTVLANQLVKPGTANDYVSAGFFGVVTVPGTNRIRIRFRQSGGNTAKIKNAFLAAIPLANIPALAAGQHSEDLSTNFSQSVSDNNYVTAKTSGSVTLASGRHIEIVAASVGGDNPIRSRPRYELAGIGLGAHNEIFGAASTDFSPTFWFIRNRRDAGATTNAVELRRNTAVTTVLQARDFTFSWMREQPDFRAQPDERVAVVADVEMGGRIYKNWNSTTTSGRFSKRLSDVQMISRVTVGEVEYTRVYSLADLSDGEWFWDSAMMDIYVELPSGDSPADSDVTVIVIPALLVGREKENLVDSAGTTLPYAPLLKDVPGATQRLSSSKGEYSASTSLGALSVVAADRRFDDALLVPATFEGFRAKVRRGFTRKSNNLADFEVVGDAVLGLAGSDFSKLTLRLFDRRLLIQRPIATTTISVKEGLASDSTLRTRDDQSLPLLYGSLRRVIAYRITTLEGGANWNEYQFAGHAVKSVSAVYLDGTTRKTVAGANLNVTAAYIDLGKVRVNNAAFPTTTEPADVVYVDLIGSTSTGASTGTALQTPGAIARHILATYGGVSAKHLVEPSFRMIDRRWRYQINSGIIPTAPKVGLVIDGAMNTEDALSELCSRVFAFWKVNRQGRVAIDVPDLTVGNICRNPGFEDDSTSGFPWRVKNSATFVTTTSRKYNGARSAEVSNGGSPDAAAAIAQNFTLPSGGSYVVTFLASLLSGASTLLRIGVTGPSGVETLSDPMVLETGKWTRHSLLVETEPGDAGHTELRIYPAHGSTVATSIALDDVEVYRIAVLADSVRSEPRALSFLDEHYYEAAVTYDVNLQASNRVAERIIADMEARGLSSSLPSEGKFAIQSSKRIAVKALATDGPSAAGIGAPIVLHYSRQRHQLELIVHGLERLPIVGEYVYHRLNPRVPEMANEYPVWRITEVKYDDANAKIVKLKAERQNDPVADRVDISPDSVPMGGIPITLASGAITDYAEVTDLRNQFAMGASSPDVATQLGGTHHTHSLSHVHAVPSHQHSATPSSHGIDGAGAVTLDWEIEYLGKYAYPAAVGPQAPVDVHRGLTDGGHTHPVPGAPSNVGASSGTSATPTSLSTVPGPNEPDFRRVKFMQRTANTTGALSQDLIVGYRSASIPAGWTRVTDLDGLYLRGATTNGAVSTRVNTSAFTTSDSGSTLNVLSGTNISIGKRLTITNTADASKVVRVVVTGGSGTAWTVMPMHETADQDNSYSFPNSANSTVTGDSEVVNTAFSAGTHKHTGAMPSHTHSSGGHVHSAAAFNLGSATNAIVAQKFPGNFGAIGGVAASLDHQHPFTITAPGDNTTSGSASGTIADDLEPALPFYELVFMKPVDANQTVLPAGSIIFWAQSADAPGGWGVLTAAVGIFVKGAAASPAAPGSGDGGHVHTQSNSSHTLSHAHGGTVIQPSAAPMSGVSAYELIAENAAASTISVAAGSDAVFLGGHAHPITAQLSTVNPGLSASSHSTGAALSGLPYHKKIVLIQKL